MGRRMLSSLLLLSLSSFSVIAVYTVAGSVVPTCQAFAVNYITHQLPQQCLRTGFTAELVAVATVVGARAGAGATAVLLEGEDVGNTTIRAITAAGEAPKLSSSPEAVRVQVPLARPSSTVTAEESITTATTPTSETGVEAEAEAEDSPLDTAKFLSFEEWKARNLERVGQSSDWFENRVKEPRKGGGAGAGVNSGALDALGEDAEIEIDFGDDSGGGAPAYKVVAGYRWSSPSSSSSSSSVDGSPDPRGYPRIQNAGTTCKERFNYASFDCAATVHKTNPECKGATSILVENKDSYMLNKCGADRKFFIVELCDDILVDTVVLANFEFFSSMFRSFRVSVSDRYPVNKQNGWKNLGTFEARNSREVQAFLIENPLIWARYLKVEFLTQYGSEFYCPVSLLRVHGTTMMEEFKHQMEAGGGSHEGDVAEEVVPEMVGVEPTEDARVPDTPLQDRIGEAVVEEEGEEEKEEEEEEEEKEDETGEGQIHAAFCALSPALFGLDPALLLPICEDNAGPSTTPSTTKPRPEPPSIVISAGTVLPSTTVSKTASSQGAAAPSSASSSREPAPPSSSQPKKRETAPSIYKTAADATVQEARPQPPPPSPASVMNSPPAVPTTQESFFKTVHKRLALLEANASLSLQYIEEQSRILRDAFVKVEKRQMEKTTQFIERLNSTVLAELHGYKQQYDQLWQSTVIALESQREQSEREMIAISSRLTLLADEVIFQKRMYQLQSVLLLITIAIVLFSRNSYPLDTPLLQHLRSRSAIPNMLDTPPTSPMARGLTPRQSKSHHRRSSSPLSPASAAAEFSPPTPPEYSSCDGGVSIPGETQSSPATPSGTRDSSRNRDREAWPQSQFGPKLKVDGQGRRWQRLPSPLGNYKSECEYGVGPCRTSEGEGGEEVGIGIGIGEPGNAMFSTGEEVEESRDISS